MSDSDLRIGPGVPEPTPPQPPILPLPAKRRIHPLVIVAAVAAVGVLCLGVGIIGVLALGSKPGSQVTLAATTTPAAAKTAAAEPPKPTYHQPGKSDFVLTVKTLKKECFGSAGCIVNFRVDPKLNGDFTLDPSKEYELTYEIRGGEEPLINTMTITGDQYSHDDEETIETKSSKAKLTAVITDISEH